MLNVTRASCHVVWTKFQSKSVWTNGNVLCFYYEIYKSGTHRLGFLLCLETWLVVKHAVQVRCAGSDSWLLFHQWMDHIVHCEEMGV